MKKQSIWKKYGYFWVTLAIFLISFIGHWAFGWEAYKEEQSAHNQPVEVNNFLTEITRDTLENWQSEFLQLMWQVAGLALLFHVGSPQSKEGSDRVEEKIDELLKKNHPEGESVIKKLDDKYARD
ncbi:MAG TPA: DUF6766 family protein [Candidatus Binatia bacterium]|nr:DUF6766 family protein [Candidatus Binatia bacterium]